MNLIDAENPIYYCSHLWLGIVDKVKTELLSLGENIFIPELSFYPK